MLAATRYAEAIGHHGELIQGMFEDEDAQLRRALVSLPCRHLKSKATFRPNEGETVSVMPASCEKADWTK